MVQTIPDPQTSSLSFEEYLVFQGKPDVMYELFRGQLIPMPTPTLLHTSICQYLVYVLQQLVVTEGLDWVAKETVGVRTEDNSARIPDVLLCSQSLWEGIQLRSGAGVLNFGEIPHLVIEVTSENWREDYIRKRSEYALIDIPEYWIVDPTRQQICVCSHPDGLYGYEQTEFKPGEMLRSSLLPNLHLPVNLILAPPLVEDLIRQQRDRQQAELEQERQRAEAERQRTEAERQRAERLAAKLRQLNIDPDLL